MKLKNIRKFAIGLAAISIALIQFGCEQDWQEDYDSSVLDSANTATVAVSAVKDSTAMIDYSLSTVGRIFIAVVPGTDEVETPDAQAILKLSVSDAVFATQIIMNDASALSGSVKVPGLVQNTSYKVFVLPVNKDAVLGTIATTDAFTTGDTYKPVLDLDGGVSPAISSSASQSKDFEIKLTFNEPVVLATTIDIKLGYYDPSGDVMNWIPVVKDSISISSNVVTIKQMKATITGEKVYLSIAEGSITDRSDNEYVGIVSGRIQDDADDAEVGDMVNDGIYWRTSWEAKAALKVLPSDTVFVTDASAFDLIKLVYPIELSAASLDDYESSFIKVRYYDSELSQDYNVPAGDVDIDGDTLFVYLPKTANYGSNVALSIEEGAVWDVYGNDVAASDFADLDWFISYGYTRDKIVGEYTIEATYSNMNGAISESYDITMSKDPDVDKNVFITGFLGSTDTIIATFDGDLATFTIKLADPDEYLGQMVAPEASYALGDTLIEFYNGFNDSGNSTGFIAADGSISFSYFSGGVDAIISLAKEVPQSDGSFSYEGWWEQWLVSTFVPKSAKGSKSSINYNNEQIPDLIPIMPEAKLKR